MAAKTNYDDDVKINANVGYDGKFYNYGENVTIESGIREYVYNYGKNVIINDNRYQNAA